MEEETTLVLVYQVGSGDEARDCQTEGTEEVEGAAGLEAAGEGEEVDIESKKALPIVVSKCMDNHETAVNTAIEMGIKGLTPRRRTTQPTSKSCSCLLPALKIHLEMSRPRDMCQDDIQLVSLVKGDQIHHCSIELESIYLADCSCLRRALEPLITFSTN